MKQWNAPLALEDLITAAQCVARCASNDRAAMTRAAWIIRNRARHAWRARQDGTPSPYGDGSVAAAAGSLAAELGPASRAPAARRMLRAAGAVCLVLAGDRPDVTGGALSAASLKTI